MTQPSKRMPIDDLTRAQDLALAIAILRKTVAIDVESAALDYPIEVLEDQLGDLCGLCGENDGGWATRCCDKWVCDSCFCGHLESACGSKEVEDAE